jgi:hypothetical protein
MHTSEKIRKRKLENLNNPDWIVIYKSKEPKKPEKAKKPKKVKIQNWAKKMLDKIK